MSCCAPNCRNRRTDGYRLFHFPTGDKDRRKRWIHNVGRRNFEPKWSDNVCEVSYSLVKYSSSSKTGTLECDDDSTFLHFLGTF